MQLAKAYGSAAMDQPQNAFYLLGKARDLDPRRAEKLAPSLRQAARSSLEWLRIDTKEPKEAKYRTAQRLSDYLTEQNGDPKFQYSGFRELGKFYSEQKDKGGVLFYSLEAYLTAVNNKLGVKEIQDARKNINLKQAKDWLDRNKEDPSRKVVVDQLIDYYRLEKIPLPDWLMPPKPEFRNNR